MIDKIIEFSIRHRWWVIALAGALAVTGVLAVRDAPIDAIPDLSENQVIVFTEWTGHSPQEIEDQITYPLTLQLEGLAGVRVVRSASDFNFSMINVILEDGVDRQSARQQVAERLTRAGGALPPGITPALGPDAAATGQIFWYTVEGPGYDLGRLRAIQDWYVRSQLSSVPGVAEVASVGGFSMEYVVEVDPLALTTHGVSLETLLKELARSNSATGGNVVLKANSEFLVRGVGLLGDYPKGDEGVRQAQVIQDLENVIVPTSTGRRVRISDLARVTLGPQPRRGILEKDGNEVTGGVVLMRQGENPLEVIRRIKEKLREVQGGLPAGVRIIPFYDRTPLIEGAVGTVTRTVIEAILTATICVLLILLHLRTSIIIAITLPLAILASFGVMWVLRRLGLADIQTNIMSLAGIAISIGVLVDSSIVMAENSMHALKSHFGDRRVQGDVREQVLPACRTVGRPIFFSVLIMLLSFLPVFALGGMEGKMFRPLAFTKSFALLAVAILAVTLVPALCTVFIRGRLRKEEDSWLLRSVIEVYRPVLDFFLDRPAGLVWILGVTVVLGLAPLGIRWLFLGALLAALIATTWLTRHWATRTAAILSLVLIARIAEKNMEPLGHEFITPLNEGMVMDMPLTWPRASVVQSGDDLKARDMVFCRFPEVDMVVGKAGRAETATDPAPMDMIETMVNFRPTELWPKRRLRQTDAEGQAVGVLEALGRQGLAELPPTATARMQLANEIAAAALPRFDALMREYAYQRNREFQRDLGPQLVRFLVELLVDSGNARGIFVRTLTSSDVVLLAAPLPTDIAKNLAMNPTVEDVTLLAQQVHQKLERLEMIRPGADLFAQPPSFADRAAYAVTHLFRGGDSDFFSRLQASVADRHLQLWKRHVHLLDGELLDRAAPTYTRLALDEVLHRVPLKESRLFASWEERQRLGGQAAPAHHHAPSQHDEADHAMAAVQVDPIPPLDTLLTEEAQRFARGLLLWRDTWSDVAGFGGELDRVMQMPGWTNVWTMPIQNRVDMLATGVSTPVGIRVLGRNLEDVVRASEKIAAVVKDVPGAANVVAEPIRGKGYLEIHLDRAKAARLGANVGDISDVVEIALGGKIVTTTIEGRERRPVRVRYASRWRESEETIQSLPVPVCGVSTATAATFPLTPPPSPPEGEGPGVVW
jgi:Cu(I)/Ag(I) efflux system membrane protein CusA/SilA